MAIGEIFKTANDRLKSPFLSSFIFSWVAFNWKAIFVVLAGKENVYTRINSIESVYLDTYSAFWYPFLVALFYTLVFPFVTVFFQRVTEQARIWSIKAKSERELLTARNEFKIEQTKAGTDDLKELNDQISKLNEDLKKESSKQTSLKTQITNLKKNVADSAKELNTVNDKFAKWFRINERDKSTLYSFFDLIYSGEFNNFKSLLSILKPDEYPFSVIKPINISFKEIKYFHNKNIIKFKPGFNMGNVMSEKEESIKKSTPKTENNLKERIELTEIGIELNEVAKYYDTLNDVPF